MGRLGIISALAVRLVVTAALALLPLGAALAAPGEAVAVSSSVGGSVLTAGGEAVAGVSVIAVGGGGAIVARAVSREDGRYLLELGDLDPATLGFRVDPLPSGYVEALRDEGPATDGAVAGAALQLNWTLVEAAPASWVSGQPLVVGGVLAAIGGGALVPVLLGDDGGSAHAVGTDLGAPGAGSGTQDPPPPVPTILPPGHPEPPEPLVGPGSPPSVLPPGHPETPPSLPPGPQTGPEGEPPSSPPPSSPPPFHPPEHPPELPPPFHPPHHPSPFH